MRFTVSFLGFVFFALSIPMPGQQTTSDAPKTVAAATPTQPAEHRYYVDGDRYSLTQAGVQRAFDDACRAFPQGVEVYLPPTAKAIQLHDQPGQLLLISCPLRVRGAGAMTTYFGAECGIDDTIPWFRIRPTKPNAVMFFEISGIQLTTSGCSTGGDAFLFDGTLTRGPAGVDIHNVVVGQGQIGGFDINMTGDAPPKSFQWFWHVYDNSLQNGVRLPQMSGDSMFFEHNAFRTGKGSSHACIDVTTQPGASHFTFAYNNADCDGGAVVIHGTTQPKILFNQIEQSRPSKEENGAVIDFKGEMAPIDSGAIIGNNINTHDNARCAIRLGAATHTLIENNLIGVKSSNGVGVLLTPSSSATAFGVNEFRNVEGGAVAVSNPRNVSAVSGLGPDGKAAAPTYSFIDAPGMGWYKAGGVLQSAVGGVDQVTITPRGDQVGATQVRAWAPTTSGAAGAADTGLSRCANTPNCVAVGNGHGQNTNGELRAAKITVNGDAITNAPRMTYTCPVLTVTSATAPWCRFIPDKPITVTRVTVMAQTRAVGCSSSPQFGVAGGTATLGNGTAAADSGPISVNFAAGVKIDVGVQRGDAGCAKQPANAMVVVEYRME